MALPQRAVINLAPQHKFKSLSKWPEAQLMLLMPRVLWNRARLYVPHFEAVNLAGRFGADPGDYEWEVISEPQGFKWWRRTISGDAAYCAAIVGPQPSVLRAVVMAVIVLAALLIDRDTEGLNSLAIFLSRGVNCRAFITRWNF